MTTAADTAPDIPATLGVREVLRLTIGGDEIIVVGAAPSGLAVILTARQWAMLKRWKLTNLRTTTGQVWAYDGRTGRLAARFLTGTDNDATKVIRYRSGNPLDLRPSNVAVVPSSLASRARHAVDRPPGYVPPYVVLPDGHVRARRQHTGPTAAERLERLLRET